jgi:hypothetical protein
VEVRVREEDKLGEPLNWWERTKIVEGMERFKVG